MLLTTDFMRRTTSSRRGIVATIGSSMTTAFGCLVGFLIWFLTRYLVGGLYTVNQNERAVKTSFGRAQRVGTATTLDDPISETLSPDQRQRYSYPQVRVIQPGGPYFKWPWERIYKVSIATETVNIGWDPENPSANHNGTMLDAVTKDQLNTGLTGQLRFRIAERNLYAYIFGIKRPYAHTMGYFVSVLRERIANFEAPPLAIKIETRPPAGALAAPATAAASPVALGPASLGPEGANVSGISINDLRKNLRDINEHMGHECRSAAARYGVVLEDTLITSIDPPRDVESALAAINTAYNHVSSDISLAQAAADQKIVQSRRAVEIETLRAQAEAEPLTKLAAQLGDLDARSPGALAAYVRNVRLAMLDKAQRIIIEAK
jgi:regulator of protease activity HflC (stomatin/prohibitin superfamily)